MIISDNFLLGGKTAARLYHDHAKDMPIFDYHCHLDPKEICEDKEYENIAQMWLGGDHYKWRLMRMSGVDEHFITGGAGDYEKFEAFIGCLQYAVGNPMYHWCALELKRYFDSDIPIRSENASALWERCGQKRYSPKKLIEMSNVKALCTTDDPMDSLAYHRQLADYKVKILPSFRPDKAYKKGFAGYVRQLGNIRCFDDLMAALEERLLFFIESGCRVSDHGLDTLPSREGNADAVLKKALAGEEPDGDALEIYQTAVLAALGRLYKKHNIAMQLHMNVVRNNNTEMFKALGADTGFDSVRDMPVAARLSKLLDKIGDLPKTVLYSLNPADNYTLATMAGNFRDIQFGSGWWFNDHIDGMRAQMKALANVGALGRFIGMLTDSRSFLSYPRHEYFRRILCNLLGEWVDGGLFPDDDALLGKIVRDICFHNAAAYFA